MTGDADSFDVLLAAAGLPASDSERAALVSGMEVQRQQLAALWAVDGTRYAEPALIFHAEPLLDTWRRE